MGKKKDNTKSEMEKFILINEVNLNKNNNKIVTSIIKQISMKDNLKISILETAKLRKPEYRMTKRSFGGFSWLKTSFLEYGLIVPIIVNLREDGSLVIIDGYNVNKMWKALKNQTIQAIVWKLSIEDEQKLHIQLNRLTKHTDNAAILNHLDHISPEFLGLKAVSEDENDDDKDHLEKENEKARIKSEENKAKGIQRWRFTYDKITYEKLKHEMKIAKNEFGKKYDAEILEMLLMNWKKLLK